MNKKFARKLIEHPCDQTPNELFDEVQDGVFWVNWREADEDIIGLAARIIGGDKLSPEWIDGKLNVKFHETLTEIPLKFEPGEQDITLLALNKAIEPEFEIRFIEASDGGDTLAFLILDKESWSELDLVFGTKVDDAFTKIESGSSFFGD